MPSSRRESAGSRSGPVAGRLAGIDLNLLLVLDALLDEKSVTRAARRVGLSQSATSHALGRLRSLLGDRLLIRTARAMALTPRARDLSGPIKRALAQLDEAIHGNEPADPSAAVQAVHVAAIDYAQMVLVPSFLTLLARAAPGIDVVVHPYREDVARELREGRIDLAIGLARRLPELHQRELTRDTFTCLLRRGHPALRERLTLARFAAMNHVVVSPRGATRGAVDHALAERGRERRVVLTVPHFAVAAAVVASSDSVMTVAERVAASPVAAAFPLVNIKPPLPLDGMTLALAWHARQHDDPVQAWVRERLVALADAHQMQRVRERRRSA